MSGTPSTPDWWADLDPAGIPADDLVAPQEPLQSLRDRLSLAMLAHGRCEGADAQVSAALDRCWRACAGRLDRPATLAALSRILGDLDRIERERVEPPAWHHLRAAETLAAQLREDLLRG